MCQQLREVLTGDITLNIIYVNEENKAIHWLKFLRLECRMKRNEVFG